MNPLSPSVYIVDDDPSLRDAVGSLIRSTGMKAQTFASAQEFLAYPRPDVPSCLVLDVQMPGLNGLDLQQELINTDAQIPVIFLTGHGDIPTSVRAIKEGALEFLTKPFSKKVLLDVIQQAIARHPGVQQLSQRNVKEGFEEIVGESAALQSLLARVAKVAPTDSTVLILGETGTGKELFARAIHRRSHRSGRAFVSVNCAAIPSSLIACELFGHEKGAFTGATDRRLGRFELASGGTIFLDEVGELPPDTQVALLRVLQEREFERVGGTRTVQADVRVIAATNRNLDAATTNGSFRSDLFYRLNVFPIGVPPLRERRDDVLVLLEHFVHHFAKKVGKNFAKIDKRTLELFQSYDWPGNIRELQNVIERSVIVCSGDVFCVDEAWLSRGAIRTVRREAESESTDGDANREREIIVTALEESRGRVYGLNGAAAKLRVPPTTLDSKIKKLKIHKSYFKLC
jgi:DNA-binding NtrC family response regulator